MSGRPRHRVRWIALPFGCAVCRAEGRAVARHAHRSHLATVAAEGVRTVVVGGATITLVSGAVLLIPAGVVHATAAGGVAVSLSLPRALLPDLVGVEIAADPDLAGAIAALAAGEAEPRPALAAVLAGLRRRAAAEAAVPAPRRLPPTAGRMQAQVREARRRIEAGAPLAEAAVDAGFYDQSQMTRQFLRLLGMTPGDYRDGAARTEPIAPR